MVQGSFFPLQSYSKKTLRKNVPKSARKYKRNVLIPPGHPIILLKFNYFSMAAVSVKRSNGPLFIMTVLEFFIVFNLFKATIKMVSSLCLLRILRLLEYEKKSPVFLTNLYLNFYFRDQAFCTANLSIHGCQRMRRYKFEIRIL